MSCNVGAAWSIRMGVATPPRYIVPGQTGLVSVRCTGRMMRLRPDPDTVRIIRYCLGAVSDAYHGRIALHEYCFLSNHYHLLLTDRAGCLPDFMRDLNSLISRCLNAHRGLSGANFEKHYNFTVDLAPEKVLEHAVYVLGNPVEADLVARCAEWPGVSSRNMQYGQPVQVDRPALGLWKGTDGRAPRTKFPEQVELVLERPPVEPGSSDETVRNLVFERLRQVERACAKERKASGRHVLGARAAQRVHYDARPKPETMFQREPSFAGVTGEARKAVVAALTAFRRAYCEASARFRAGVRDVVFPLGTWLLRVRFGVACDGGVPALCAALGPP